jgi:hypothetical protein
VEKLIAKRHKLCVKAIVEHNIQLAQRWPKLLLRVRQGEAAKLRVDRKLVVGRMHAMKSAGRRRALKQK